MLFIGMIVLMLLMGIAMRESPFLFFSNENFQYLPIIGISLVG